MSPAARLARSLDSRYSPARAVGPADGGASRSVVDAGRGNGNGFSVAVQLIGDRLERPCAAS